jgi:chromosome segregation ATPase
VNRIELPEKQLKDLRSQILDILEARKSGRSIDASSQRQIDEVNSQIRDIHTHLGKISDSQRQLRDLVQELDSAMGEVRQEAVHLAELQSMEEQRLRRQGMELQGLFEALRQQFGEVASRSQRVDDVRRQLTERLDVMDETLERQRVDEATIRHDIGQLEKTSNEQYLLQQERLENVRSQIEAQLGEMRNIGDQRTDRIMTRFNGVDERLRAIEQLISEFPTRFEALERRDEVIGSEADSIEEWLVLRQIEALEHVLDDVRKRRADRATTFGTRPGGKAKDNSRPGSVYNPEGLIKSVRDARPPSRKQKEEAVEEDEES